MDPPRFTMPAEWEPHAAVWTGWPWDPEQWGEGLAAPRRQIAAMIQAIVDVDTDGRPRGEPVELLVRDEDRDAVGAMLGAAAAGVRFHGVPYGDIWLRDTGPLFLRRPGELLAATFRFDGWGGKYVMAGDSEVASHVAAIAGTPTARFDFVLEGGAIEVDGAGTLLATRQCVFGTCRNPTLDEAALTARLAYALAVDRVVWLDGTLANDHTDGHIDTLARFIAPGVVACMVPARDDPNRAALEQVLAGVRAAGLEVVPVPGPGAIVDAAGALLPASYLNFYIANTTVVVPTYGATSDDAAVAAIAAAFPGRRTVGVHAAPVVVGGGAFHCSTQQQPVPGSTS